MTVNPLQLISQPVVTLVQSAYKHNIKTVLDDIIKPSIVPLVLALVAVLILLALPAVAQQDNQASYLIDKQLDEIKHLHNSIDSLLPALTAAAEQQGQQSLSQTVNREVLSLYRQSEQLIAQGKLQQARKPLIVALNKVKIAINALKGTPVQPSFEQTASQSSKPEPEATSEFVLSKRQQDIDKQKSTIAALMQALSRIGEEKQQLVMVQDVASQVADWGEQSDELARQNKLLQARQLLDQSLVAIKTAIAALRNNETLTRSLNFENPQDEFDYEVDRFDTYQMLLQMMVLPKPELTDAQRVQIEQKTEQADKLRVEADRQAAQGQFVEAIVTLETAAQTLLKAIRIGGIYLPG